nr:T9SS type A sorting domain-containing protein [uncultured Flavobacterium sp.]
MKLHFRKILFLSIAFFTSLTYSQNTNGNWTIKGPIAFPTNISGQIHGIGRVSQVKFHPSNPQKMYAVSASGGLWTSNDEGQNWSKTATDNQIPQGSCSAVCIDYTNDNILYLSTGDANYYGDGYGIYKSTDGGMTWASSNSGIGNRMALEILISPNNHNTLLACTTDGIWKSTDSGQTWLSTLNGGAFKDMVYKPNSLNTVYAVTDNTFWKSTDDGSTWTQISSVNPGPGNGGRIAVSAANDNIVYVGFVGSNSASGQGGIIYQSTDGGTTFTLKKGDVQPNLNGYEGNENGQGNYNWGLFADRTNANILYACGHVVWKSTDAGTNWSQLTNWWEKCHTDMHQIITSPYNNNKFFNINDGGIFLSTDGGIEWTPSADGLSATEIYHMGQSKLSRNITSIGTQDNGEIYLNGNTWYCNRGGDWGSKSSFDYANPNTVYYHENAERRDLVLNSGGNTFGIATPNNNDKYVFSDLNTSFALISQGIKLKKTTNLLTANPSWTTIKTFTANVKSVAVSPTHINEIYVVLDNNKVYYSSNGSTFAQVSTTPSATNAYSTIAVNKNNTNIVYVTCGSKIYRSTNKGVNWTDISGTLSNVNILNLVHDPYSTNESFYLATAFGVYYRNNTMTDWQSFSGGLPLIAQISDLFGYFDGTDNSIIRVSFYGRGVWESGLYTTTLSDNEFANNIGTISIYPNPSTDIITINITQPELINTKAFLMDINGKQIKEIHIKQPVTLIDFTNYSKGIYFLKFKNNVTKKVVVQ